jgi:CDP-glucose 4,6-dehydratase
MMLNSPLGALPTADFWKNKRVLVTGNTGFKGAWLALWLSQMGARVSGISLPPNSEPSLFKLMNADKFVETHYLDIRDDSGVKEKIIAVSPEIVLHLAAQPLVLAGYRDSIETFQTNVMGTCNILEAVRHVQSVRTCVLVTTDKVYRMNPERGPFNELSALGGHDPYSASKAACEIVIGSYRDSFLAERGVGVASARGGNVIGGGDWSKDRLIPDAVRAWGLGQALVVRRPESIRPWQYVLDCLCGYLVLAERLWSEPELAGAYNFGPSADENVNVRQLMQLAQGIWRGANVVWRDGESGEHEAQLLSLDVARAALKLGVSNRWPLSEGLRRTLHWYQAQSNGADAYELCCTEIRAFCFAQKVLG